MPPHAIKVEISYPEKSAFNSAGSGASKLPLASLLDAPSILLLIYDESRTLPTLDGKILPVIHVRLTGKLQTRDRASCWGAIFENLVPTEES
jgi:hypothetical protein|tara:strand:- start:181 stop:456 length:276 start_codon:yes stop_codon:yes gene_type:complete